MRRRIAISLGLIGAGTLGVMTLLLGTGEPPQNAHAEDAAVSKTEENKNSSDKKRPHIQPVHPKIEASDIDISDIAQERDIRLSSAERREGENDQNYDLRIKFLAKYDKLIRQAKLTPKQIPLVLSRFADAQEQSVLAWEAMELSDTTPPFESISLSEVNKTLNRDFYTSLREVMSHEQMVRFRHISIIGSPLGFGNYLPLEIQRETE